MAKAQQRNDGIGEKEPQDRTPSSVVGPASAVLFRLVEPCCRLKRPHITHGQTVRCRRARRRAAAAEAVDIGHPSSGCAAIDELREDGEAPTGVAVRELAIAVQAFMPAEPSPAARAGLLGEPAAAITRLAEVKLPELSTPLWQGYDRSEGLGRAVVIPPCGRGHARWEKTTASAARRVRQKRPGTA
jgi:hypothetical protein